ncbi:uncharacterized protein LOC124798375 [Schistocerca piceifrons]|uniref:uncharacterized protein LOC124798375 n=1 Tax=Schistocerca piceifrons TaxID=274613 RepID=UPI001F5EFE49|nr:uncharacterized protein LOC124798375 [Schistocerca piceifrons]
MVESTQSAGAAPGGQSANGGRDEAVPSAPTTRSPESEERRRTGQYMALGVVAATFLVGLYHACLQKNAALAGLLVPSLIMIVYLAWVLYSARKKKYGERRRSSALESGGLTPRAARRLAEHCYSNPQQDITATELNNASTNIRIA